MKDLIGHHILWFTVTKTVAITMVKMVTRRAFNFFVAYANVQCCIINNNFFLPVNWPKLLGPFQNVLPPFYMCSECYSTYFPVQRSQIYFLLCFIII